MEHNQKREGVKAIETAPYSKEQIQAAKDFIWEHLEAHTHPILIEMAGKSPEERKSMYLKRIFIRAEAKAPYGILADEILIIGFEYNPQ
jgi:hypothetical protein